jgi:outer membrane protein
MASNIKIRVLAVALALTGCASIRALAQGTADSNKVAIVSIQDAIANTNEGKKELEALQQKFAPKQAEMKTLNDDVENLKKQLQAQGDKLSDEERGNRVKTISDKQKVLQRNYEDAQNEYQQAEQEIVNRLGKRMMDILEKYAKTNGYAVVMDVSNPQTPVLYASPNTNITKELVDAYNTDSPAAPAAKPAAGNAAARPPATGATTPKKP